MYGASAVETIAANGSSSFMKMEKENFQGKSQRLITFNTDENSDINVSNIKIEKTANSLISEGLQFIDFKAITSVPTVRNVKYASSVDGVDCVAYSRSKLTVCIDI